MSCVFTFPNVYSEEKSIVDFYLRNEIRRFNINPIKELPLNSNRPMVELGRKLFSEKKMSGNRRVSCQTCHNPATATTDHLPLSQTENGRGVLRRNAPGLFNIGLDNKNFMFLDGRVHYDSKKKIFTTPEESINGANSKTSPIALAMNSALSAQILFPLVTHNEMLGKKGENEIADAKDNLEAWDRIVARIKGIRPYKDLIRRAFPNVILEKINIGHLAESIASFEREEFQSSGSPFHQYLKGDNGAMTINQKKGFILFLGRAQCINCHQGSELGNNHLFASSAVPHWGEVPLILDKGRGAVVKDSEQNFFFRVPSLINVSLTGPYMHNGAFENLGDVIDHYNNISSSLNSFQLSEERRHSLPVEVDVVKDTLVNDEIWLSSQSRLIPRLENRLFLTKTEKRDLEIFLKEALTDPKWAK